MQSEKAVRSFRDDMRAVIKRDPHCPCLVCRIEVAHAKELIESKIEALSWVLGECVEMDARVESAAKMAHEDAWRENR